MQICDIVWEACSVACSPRQVPEEEDVVMVIVSFDEYYINGKARLIILK